MKLWMLLAEDPGPRAAAETSALVALARAWGRAGFTATVFAPAPADSEEVGGEGLRWRRYASAIFRTEDSPAGSRPPDQSPRFPFNVLEEATARSHELATVLARWLQAEGPPDALLAPLTRGLAYYLLQRRLLEPGFAEGFPIVLEAFSFTPAARFANHQPAYLLPDYWHGRMELACVLAADGIICPSSALARELRQAAAAPDLPVAVLPPPWPSLVDPADSARASAPADPAGPAPGPESTVSEPSGGPMVEVADPLDVAHDLPAIVHACARLWAEGADFTLRLRGPDQPFPARGGGMLEFLRRRHARWWTCGRLRWDPVDLADPPAADDSSPTPVETPAPARPPGLLLAPGRADPCPWRAAQALRHGGLAPLVHPGAALADWLGAEGFRPLPEDAIEPVRLAEALRAALAADPGEWRRTAAAARAALERLLRPAQAVAARREFLSLRARERRPPVGFPFVSPSLRAPGPGLAPFPPDPREDPGGVSAVIPHHNLGRYVEEAVDSLAASSPPPREIVVVDDGSDDPDSLAALRRLEERGWPGLRVLRQLNAGLAAARNVGARAARGEFLLFCDADDAVEPAFAARAVAVLRRYPNVHFVYAWERYFEGSRDLWPTFPTELPYLLGHNQVTSRALVRRASFLRHGLNKPSLPYNFEDYDGWLSLVEAGCGGVALPEILLRYRIRPNSLWQTSSRAQHLWLHEAMAADHPELYRQHGLELFALLNANGPAHAWNRPAASSPYEDREAWLADHLRRVDAAWSAAQAEITRLHQALAARDRAAPTAGTSPEPLRVEP